MIVVHLLAVLHRLVEEGAAPEHAYLALCMIRTRERLGDMEVQS